MTILTISDHYWNSFPAVCEDHFSFGFLNARTRKKQNKNAHAAGVRQSARDSDRHRLVFARQIDAKQCVIMLSSIIRRRNGWHGNEPKMWNFWQFIYHGTHHVRKGWGPFRGVHARVPKLGLTRGWIGVNYASKHMGPEFLFLRFNRTC